MQNLCFASVFSAYFSHVLPSNTSLFSTDMTHRNFLSSSSFIFLIILSISLLLSSCQSENQKENKAKDAPVISDNTPEPELLTDKDKDCPLELNSICNRGLSFAPLGLKIADLHVEEVEGVVETDSLDYEMGYVRLNRSFMFVDGSVLLEGSAIPEADANDELLSASNLSRIRIESPRFQTADGVRVGMSIQNLQEIYTGEEISIASFASVPEFSGNPKYEFLMIYPEKHPNITYLMPDPGHQLYKNAQVDEMELGMLPKAGKISSIVVSE